MKKLLSSFLTVLMLFSIVYPVFAYDFTSEIDEKFLYNGNLYLTKETKAGEISYFGDRVTICSADGTFLTADDYIKTGDELVYFGILKNTITVIGDVDCNGKISASDARYVLRLSANMIPFKDRIESYGAVDANGSGMLEASDAREILRVSAKIDNFGKFEEKIKAETEKQNNTEYEYSHDFVMVCMNPAFVNNSEAYKPEFYSDLVGKVEKWITYAPDHVWLKIYLKDQSKENLDTLYEQCQQNDAIISTCKNQIIHVEW